jgi:flagellar FliL protein
MGIFDDIKAKGAAYRLSEEVLYAEALRELESGQRRDGIWAKAMSESDMDQSKAGAKYIKLRVISLKDEITVFMEELKRAEVQLRQPPQTVTNRAEVQIRQSPQAITSSEQRGWGTRLLGVLVIFAAIGGTGFLYVSKQKADAAALAEEGGNYPDASASTAHASPSPYLPLDNMVVNLADPSGESVAQVGITLQMRDMQSVDAVKMVLPTIRSSLLQLLSQRTSEDLLSAEGKQKLITNILEVASVPFGSKANSPVIAVLFSSLIVQGSAGPVNKPQPNSTPDSVDVLSTDYCAPNISREERLRRLATHGPINQVDEGWYFVGEDRSLHYYSDGSVLSCQ